MGSWLGVSAVGWLCDMTGMRSALGAVDLVRPLQAVRSAAALAVVCLAVAMRASALRNGNHPATLVTWERIPVSTPAIGVESMGASALVLGS